MKVRADRPEKGGAAGPPVRKKSDRAPIRAADSEGFSIRSARASDIPQVIALDEQVTGLAKAEYWQSLFARYSRPAEPEHFFLVAVAPRGAADTVLGFILGEIRAWEFGSAPCGWVIALSVKPDARLRGLGQALLDEIAGRFAAAGLAKMRTMVARDNRLLLLFFRAGGLVSGPYFELEKELG
jgi:ribosomal protein S18 acetylase RimI-like enzyme